MAIIGLIHLASVIVPPTSSQSPAATITSHLSDLFPTQVHHSYHLDHRLFVSTSSLLPNSDSRRTYTHLLTLSHLPNKTFVGTTSLETSDAGNSKKDDNLSIITIPTSTSLESFTSLIQQKLQPQWAARQFMTLENGASITLPIIDDAKWKISVGDLRLAPSRLSGSAAGQSRGVVIELQYEAEDVAANVDIRGIEDTKKYEMLFRGFLKSLFKRSKLDLRLDDAKTYLTKTKDDISLGENEYEKSVSSHEQQKQRNPTYGFEIAELYMEVLRGSRT